MNLTDRLYVAVHVALTLLVCVRWQQVEHWRRYVAWNLIAIAVIMLFASQKREGTAWEFAHDWFPVVLFTSVFEEVSFLSLSLLGSWQEAHIIRFESLVFPAPPIVLLRGGPIRHVSEVLELGYFWFYPLYPLVAGVLWGWRTRPRYRDAFRQMTDAISIGYLPCYAAYLLFPTQSPRGASAIRQLTATDHGPFHFLVGLIQHNAGVHGNAFPSAHIMLAFVVLVFAWRYLPQSAPWLLLLNILMCLGAVYDGYHYASDVVAGALIGLIVAILSLRQHKGDDFVPKLSRRLRGWWCFAGRRSSSILRAHIRIWLRGLHRRCDIGSTVSLLITLPANDSGLRRRQAQGAHNR